LIRDSLFVGSLYFVGTVLATHEALAQTIAREGTEYTVNAQTIGVQDNPSIQVLGAGTALVAWDGPFSATNLEEPVWARRITRTGPSSEIEFQVSTTTGVSNNRTPETAGVPGSGFVVVWENQYAVDGSGMGIFGRRLDNVGEPTGTEFRVNTYTTFNQLNPAVAADSEGAVVVIWSDEGERHDAPRADIRGQRYAADGTLKGTEFVIATGLAEYAHDPRVSAFASTGFVVVWSALDEQATNDVYGRRYNSIGEPEGSAFRVNSYTTDAQLLADVVTCGDEGFLVVWQSFFQDGNGSGVFGQWFGRDGAKSGEEFQINQYTTEDQTAPVVRTTPACNAIVLWQSFDQDGDAEGVFGRVIRPTGTAATSEFQVNAYTTSQQGFIVDRGIALDIEDDSSFAAAWISPDGDEFGIRAQWFCVLGADASGCGDTACPPVSRSGGLTASDALAVLKGAVGSQDCRLCVCDVNDSQNVTASDALLVLKKATGVDTQLSCPAC